LEGLRIGSFAVGRHISAIKMTHIRRVACPIFAARVAYRVPSVVIDWHASMMGLEIRKNAS
jgi:hypothetical protein